MKNYELIEHTADVRLKVEASTLQELFEVSLFGMAEITKKDICQKECFEQKEINLTSIDATALLVDFLSEVLGITHSEKIVFCKINIEELTDAKINCTVFGTKVDHFDEDIKAVTFHEAEIKKTSKGNFETIIVFDI
ncbi:MAG: archease [bacterium]